MKKPTVFQGFLIVVGVIAIIYVFANWNKIFGNGTANGTSNGTTNGAVNGNGGGRARAGCVKNTGTDGSVWYTFGGLEVSKQECIDRGYAV